MENLDMEWVEELRHQLSGHLLYEPLDELRIQLEPAYQRALASIPSELRQDIEQYLRVRRKLDVQLTHMAYTMGLQVGERRAARNPSLSEKNSKGHLSK